jgi:hypothetical protein
MHIHYLAIVSVWQNLLSDGTPMWLDGLSKTVDVVSAKV